MAEVTQLVGFRTRLEPDEFVERWRPIASGFLLSGLHTITLAVFGGDEPRYLSRNSWPADAYRRTFPAGLAADGGAGPVTVVQAGAYTTHPSTGAPVATARPALDLSLALLRLVDVDDAEGTTDALLAALGGAGLGQLVAYRPAHRPQRFDLVLTVHGPAGTGPDSTAALRAASAPFVDAGRSSFLTGRELLSLAA